MNSCEEAKFFLNNCHNPKWMGIMMAYLVKNNGVGINKSVPKSTEMTPSIKKVD